jgi:hypothetical protein
VAIQVMTMARLSFVLDSVLSCVEKSVCPPRHPSHAARAGVDNIASRASAPHATGHTPPKQAALSTHNQCDTKRLDSITDMAEKSVCPPRAGSTPRSTRGVTLRSTRGQAGRHATLDS